MGKRGLGRGIDALLQGLETEQDEHLAQSVNTLPISRLHPNPNQPRKNFSEEALKELSESIRSRGVLQPILVEESSDGSYMIIAGERRYRAARLAGLADVPVITRHFTDEEKLEIALIENIQRENLNPIEEAQAYRALMDGTGTSQDDLAARLGKNRSTIANSLRLLRLSDEVQQALVKGELTAGHARALLSLDQDEDTQTLFRRIIADGLSVREAENEARVLNSTGKTKGVRHAQTRPGSTKSVEIHEIEERLISALGTKVVVNGTHRKGKIEISYFSLDDLDRLIELLEP